MSTPVLKEAWELEVMRQAGRIAATALREAAAAVKPGVSTGEIDDIARECIRRMGGKSTFIGYPPGSSYPFRHTICASINEEIVHGVPSKKRLLREGDIFSIDIGATWKGYVGDCAMTVPVGQVSDTARKIIDVTRESLDAAIAVMKPGAKLSTIGAAVQNHAEERGFSVVRDYCGHGIGREMHEAPQVPNYVDAKFLRNDLVLKPGLVLAIEPMLCEGTWKAKTLPDHWTVVTADGKLSAHWEHTIAITEKGAEVLTLP